MSQPSSPGDWPDPYAAGGSPADPPAQPPYPPGGYPPGGYPPGGYPPASGPPGYGYGQSYSPYPSPPPTPPTNGLAIAALVCALAGLATGISAPVGAILGHIARKQIRERGEQGDGMALAGIVVGWILTGIMLLCCLGYVGVVGFAISQESGGL